VSGKKDKKTETSLFVIWNLYSYSTLKQLAIFTGKAIEQGKPKLPLLLPGVLRWFIESNSLKFQYFLVTFFLSPQVCQGWTGAS
jgi:hypothetical protein